MASFKDTLKKLFSRNIIITKTAGGGLKTLDVNKIQSVGANTMQNNQWLWRNSSNNNRGFIGNGLSLLGSTGGIDTRALRTKMYQDYEMMDQDSIIASALDIYADACIMEDPMNHEILQINSDNIEIQKVLYNLFYDVMNIEFNAWSWIRNLCKYGDFFLYLNIKEEVGIVNVIPIHPIMIERYEDIVDKDSGVPGVKFTVEGMPLTRTNSDNSFEEYELAHFRLLTDTHFLPYGKSIIEPCRKNFKVLLLMEESMMLQRIMRAPDKRIFKIDVGSIPPNEVDAYIEKVVMQIKKVPYIDETTGDYNLKYNVQNSLEDIFVPVRGGESGSDVTTLEGLQNEGAIEDINYFLNKLFSALKIPKAYLSYDEDAGDKIILSAQDMRFSQTIGRVQKIFISELYKIAYIHLISQGFDKADLINFELKLTNSSVIYQRQQIDLLNEQLTAVGTIRENNLFSDKHIYESIFNMSEQQWKSERDLIIEDSKYRFRLQQIVEEGNDPLVTGKSFGTSHDIVSMQTGAITQIPDSGKSTDKVFGTSNEDTGPDDGRHDNLGQPKKPGTFGTDKDKILGRDPSGLKSLNKIESLMKKIDLKANGKTYKKLDSKISKKYSVLRETLKIDNESIED